MSPRRQIDEIFDRLTCLTGAARVFMTTAPPVTIFGLLALIIWGACRIDCLIGVPTFLPRIVAWIVAAPFIIAGFVLMLWTLLRFLAARGTPVPFNPPRQLVTTGPYAVTRNPMASGFFFALVGLGLILNSITTLVVIIPGFIYLMVWFIRAMEEPQLERRFGQEYLEYKQRVPRFFPRIRTPK